MSVDTNSVGDRPEDELINSLTVLPPTAKVFEAGGKKYYVESDVSVGRYKNYQRMEVELGFNINFSKLVERLSNAYSALNENRNADAAVALAQVLDGARLFNEDRQQVALYVSTLFINTADEDRTTWSKPLADQKIQDWKNIEVNFFLSWALAQVREFPKRYAEIADLLTRVSEVRSSILFQDENYPTEHTSTGD